MTAVAAVADQTAPSQGDPLAAAMAPKSPKGKKGKKGKGKKKKQSKEEKAQEKLDKACSMVTSQVDLYQLFLDRMNRWIKRNNYKAIELYQKFDKNGDGSLTYDEFKAGLKDLDAPCNNIELEILARRIDGNGDKLIDYREFTKGLSFLEVEERPLLVTTKEELEKCECCKLGLWKPEIERAPKYLKVHLKFGTFDNLRSYPGHFDLVLHSHLTICGLIDIIKERMDLATTTLRVYADKSRTMNSLLLPDQTLAECGYSGGTRGDPEDCFLYYDYSTEFHDCAILMSDYYFAS